MHNTTSELAAAAIARLRQLETDPEHFPPVRSAIPTEKVLTDLLDVLYLATLKTDEGRPALARLCWLDPDCPDDFPPPLPRAMRWTTVPFDKSFDLTIRSLVKIAKSADPWASSIAVFPNRMGTIAVWGLVDQGVHWSRMQVREANSYPPPGLVHVIANGVGDISVFHRWTLLARLKQDTLILDENKALWEGPLSERLSALAAPLSQAIAKARPAFGDKWRDALCINHWKDALCRVLIQIQSYRHGGALILHDEGTQLNIRHKIVYNRLPEALEKTLLAELAERQEFEQLKREGHLKDVDECLTGTVRFIASLSCVDGAIFMNGDLAVQGYGVEIRAADEVNYVRLTKNSQIEEAHSFVINTDQYGTRHRSMIRFCYANRNSVGFVVSQDGDIRGIMRIGDDMVMWDNLQVRWSPDVPVLRPSQ